MNRNLIALFAAAAVAACDSASTTTPAVAVSAAKMTKIFPADYFSATVESDVSPVPKVRVDDSAGNPLQGVEVVFSDFVLGAAHEVARVRTDQAGIASVGKWTLGTRAGPQNLRAVSGRLSVVFAVEASAGPAASIVITGGSGQTGYSGFPLWGALRVRVLDRFANPVEGWPVDFAVESGGGSTSRSQTVTSANGEAEAIWTLGALGSNTARASIAGVEPVRFTATAGVPGVLPENSTFELSAINSRGGGRLSFGSGRYVLGKDGKFTTLVSGFAGVTSITGGGRYVISGTTIFFIYNDNDRFLYDLGLLEVYAYSFLPVQGVIYPAPAGQEVAEIEGDVLRVTRCLYDDCYEYRWEYRKLP